jgi:hypothetical protein
MKSTSLITLYQQDYEAHNYPSCLVFKLENLVETPSLT